MNTNDLEIAIKDNQGISPLELAELLNASPSSISYHLTRVEKLYYVWNQGRKMLFIKTYTDSGSLPEQRRDSE